MARLTLAPHVSSAELLARFRSSRDPVEKTHGQGLYLRDQGWRTEDIRCATGFSLNWIRTLIHRYNARGPEAVRDQRHRNPGQPRLLSPADEAALLEVLKATAAAGGLWSGPKVAAWMAQHLGRSVSPQRGWEVLVRLGYTPQRPRRRHAQADAGAQERFQDRGAGGPSRR